METEKIISVEDVNHRYELAHALIANKYWPLSRYQTGINCDKSVWCKSVKSDLDTTIHMLLYEYSINRFAALGFPILYFTTFGKATQQILARLPSASTMPKLFGHLNRFSYSYSFRTTEPLLAHEFLYGY